MQMNSRAAAATIFSRVECAAGAFDQLFGRIHFVGAVYIHEHFVHGVQIEHGETMPAQARGRGSELETVASK